MTLKRRIDRLTPKKEEIAPVPSMILFCAAETDEAMAAIILGGETLSRGPDETDKDFRARASAALDGGKGGAYGHLVD